MNTRDKGTLFGVWVLLAAMVTVLVGLIYAAVQGNYRQSANDPQIEIAHEISEAINKGAPADQIIPPGGGTDIKNSLSAFAAIYDKDGKLIGSSGKLGDKDPVPPMGVFEEAKKNGRNILTWQPEADVRIAAVVVPAKSGENDVYILAGKNLREVEQRTAKLGWLSIISWIILLALSGLLTKALAPLAKRDINIVENDTEVVIIEEAPAENDKN
jgi:hypothetical protein